MTLETVRLRVVDPEMLVPSGMVLPLLSIHEMVGVELPLTRLAHTRVMLPPTRTEASTSGPMNSGGSVMKQKLIDHSNVLRAADRAEKLELYTHMHIACLPKKVS